LQISDLPQRSCKLTVIEKQLQRRPKSQLLLSMSEELLKEGNTSLQKRM